MSEVKGMKKTLWTVFLIAELILWVVFLSADIRNAFDTTWLKYASILMVMLMGLLCCSVWNGRIVAAALVFTAAADIFLLVLDRWYAVGILLFCVVQILYAVRLGGRNTVWICLSAMVGLCVMLISRDPVAALAAGYITLFATNLVRAGLLSMRSRERFHILFFAGLALYFVCDVCVGLFQLSDGSIWEFARVGMWAFYLPGQVLILMSAADFEEKAL